MSIRNLSIAKKISLSFLLIALINIVFGVFLSTELKEIKSELLNYTDDTLPAMERVDAIEMIFLTGVALNLRLTPIRTQIRSETKSQVTSVNAKRSAKNLKLTAQPFGQVKNNKRSNA